MVFEDGDSQDDPLKSSPGRGPSKADILSFRDVGRPLDLGEVRDEFTLMLSFFPKGLDADDFRRAGAGCGSHLVKLTTPRAELSQSVLRFERASSNRIATLVPSVNAPDIPVAKIIFRPLAINGSPARSIVDHLRDPNEISAAVLKDFAAVFGQDCLDALRQALLGPGDPVSRLPESGEFPIIFLPRPGGGDLQATPVSPAETFMGFKNMASAWFQKQEKDAPPVPRGSWVRQSVSAKPQNISGAIGGPRQRFLAQMPSVLRGYEAAVMRYALGGNFPTWHDDHVEAAVLHYAGRLGMEWTNSDIRDGTDWYADRLIGNALAFIAEVQRDARDLLEAEGKAAQVLRAPPQPSLILMKRRWKKADHDKALQALTSPHFRDRERLALEREEA